jgi:hypothetical protein
MEHLYEFHFSFYCCQNFECFYFIETTCQHFQFIFSFVNVKPNKCSACILAMHIKCGFYKTTQNLRADWCGYCSCRSHELSSKYVSSWRTFQIVYEILFFAFPVSCTFLRALFFYIKLYWACCNFIFHTYLTSWSWALLEKPPLVQLPKNFPTF